jgi:putative SOS response-associated peptidase YedK
MCGRYSQTASLKEITERFQIAVSEVLELAPRYNIAPTQSAPVVVWENARALKSLRWGLIPHWAKDSAIGRKLLNARAETVHEKPSFYKSFQSKRCLVLADGFYEWKANGLTKTPMRAQLASRAPFAMAGLWDRWQSPVDGKVLLTYTIITTTPNETLRAVHDRMPVILPRGAESAWLDPATKARELQDMLRPSSEAMTAYAVSTAVNSPRNESPDCAKPVGE